MRYTLFTSYCFATKHPSQIPKKKKNKEREKKITFVNLFIGIFKNHFNHFLTISYTILSAYMHGIYIYLYSKQILRGEKKVMKSNFDLQRTNRAHTCLEFEILFRSFVRFGNAQNHEQSFELDFTTT